MLPVFAARSDFKREGAESRQDALLSKVCGTVAAQVVLKEGNIYHQILNFAVRGVKRLEPVSVIDLSIDIDQGRFRTHLFLSPQAPRSPSKLSPSTSVDTDVICSSASKCIRGHPLRRDWKLEPYNTDDLWSCPTGPRLSFGFLFPNLCNLSPWALQCELLISLHEVPVYGLIFRAFITIYPIESI
ncbi:hypothetical protein Hypma_008694 [Hypsizygus marmoreus]|uniref:Uncharacterized protein n=1 Tax=Hypsizygus marmoreus TaxID=39966 RepID=A0A369JSB1_HYPMA|nr:hypothetical protein Hypma_008694 [Hypsizygus marmoreus]